MKRHDLYRCSILALTSSASLLLTPAAATADEHWVINTTFSDGGTLTGFIDFNVNGYVSAFNLRTSAVGAFPGFDFTPGHGNIAPFGGGVGTTSVVLFGPGYNVDNLVLNASAPFTASQHGNYLAASSYECLDSYGCPAGPATRYLSGQSLMGVPEPASWALMLLGFGGLGLSLRRRRERLAA